MTSDREPPSPHVPVQPHIPVLREAVLEGLRVQAGGRYIDGTVGAGGHSLAILESAPGVHLLGIDTDPIALELASERLAPYVETGQARLVRANFEEMGEVARREAFGDVDGVL